MSWLDAWESERLRKGDGHTVDRLIRREHPRVLRFLVHLTGNLDDAQDLAQQVFSDIPKLFEDFQGRCSTRTWLHRVAYRQYTNWRRLRTCDPIDEYRVETVPGRSEDAIVLAVAIADLPSELRDAFVLCEVQQLKVSEAAAVLQVPVGTVKSRTYAARQRLRLALADAFELDRHPNKKVRMGGNQ